MTTWSLFLDDIRHPTQVPSLRNAPILHQLRIARSSAEAKEMVDAYGCPSFISFDHDLADEHYVSSPNHTLESKEETGYEFAKWLVFKDLQTLGKFIPQDFTFNVHSMNPVGAYNIRQYLNSYLNYKRNG
jgi:hypothetical protein